MKHRLSKNADDSIASMKQMMTAVPTSPEMYAAIMRKKVQARRMVEDALEAARTSSNDALKVK